MAAPWETFAPWEDAASNYAKNVGSAARELYTSSTKAPWETATGLGQAALEAGSGTLKALNTAANDLLPGDKKALQKEIDTDPVMNYHATSPTGKAATNLLGQVTAPVGSAAGWANNKIRAVAGDAAAATLADIVTLATGKQAAEHPDVPVSEMTTYHGTPHVFKPTEKNELGEFKTSQIGTGEGNQAYGHGIYVAENKDTGLMYRSALNDWKPKGVDMEKGSVQDRAAAYWAEQKDAGAQNPALSAAQNAKKFLDEDVSVTGLDPEQQKRVNAIKDTNKAIVKQLEDWHRSGQEFERGGALYHVDVPDKHIDKMLNWDKPLHEQTPEVQKAFKEAPGGLMNQRNGQPYTMRKGSPIDGVGIKAELELTADNTGRFFEDNPKGNEPSIRGDVQSAIAAYVKNPDNNIARNKLNRYFHDYPYDKEQFGSAMEAMESEHGVSVGDLYKSLSYSMGHPGAFPEIKIANPAAVSDYLRSQGIPGIKYLDAISRSSGDGTRNLVLFDPSIATITHRE